jgi:hypothetical protein
VPVRSATLPYATCAYCQSLLLRTGQGAEDIGKVAELPYDISPIQLGTVLGLEGGLQVVGRVRWGWDGGSWNEWLAMAPDGTERWLAEAMGMYMLTALSERALAAPAAHRFAGGAAIEPGAYLETDGKGFVATDVKQAECLGSEGDLPFRTLPGRTMTNVDFRAMDGAALSLQRDEDGTKAWIGHWYDLAGLSPKGLRAIEGWVMPRAWL